MAKNYSRNIDETDEMKIKLLTALGAPDSNDALYPEELNTHLLEQLKVMTCENNGLRKCVMAKDQEIKELTATVADLNQRIRDLISGGGPAISSKSAGVISGKITDLCKQNRHLVAELEGYKTKNSILERKIMELEIKTKSAQLHVCVCNEEPDDTNSDELKELNNKLAVVNKKLMESKSKNLELKNDILVATKILQQELGEKFTNIKNLQNDLAGWKGRAQQILLLQQKIADYEEKLNGRNKDIVDIKKRDQAQLIKDLELRRKREIDQSLKEFEALKTENKELKKKLDGAKCRIRNLECDVTMVKQKMHTLLEKSHHDDTLINEQRAQIKNVESYYQEMLNENTAKMKKLQDEICEYQKVIQTTDSKIYALTKQMTEKAAKIEQLRNQLLKYEECSLQNIFFAPMRTATDNEIQKLSDLAKTLNKRLDEEREKWNELDNKYRKLKIQKSKLERNNVSLENELTLLKASKRGSQVSRTSLTAGEMPGIKKIATKHTESTSSSEQRSEINMDLEKKDLLSKLELTEEKIKILEDKLQMVEEEKQYDYEHLTEMIQTSKQLFGEALKVLQKEKCVCS